ncbi:MAG: hypothetical protein CME61_04205 [Halobacteriovoraceae bacterium]|nr:hypothetical protein [Halobacteriovoraceae bacterium]
MIKINLIEQKKPLKIPVIMGIDITKVNWSFLLVAFVVYKAPGWFIYPRFENQVESKNKEIVQLNKQNKALIKNLSANREIQNKIEDFEQKIKELKLKTAQIENILKNKTNPGPALKRIAQDIPSDLWLNSLSVKDGNAINIQGMSYSFRSITNFYTNINDSKYYSKSLDLTDSKTLLETHKNKKRRVESFTIVGKMNVSLGVSL